MILKVGNKIIEKFNDVNVSLKYDSVASTFSFAFYYDTENTNLKELAKPLSYSKCTIEHDGELLITGTILSHKYLDGSLKYLTGVGGYSTPGVLEDCEIPTSLYPLQSDGKSLVQIAERLIKPFGIKLITSSVVSGSANKAISVSTAEVSISIKGYLATIAAQRNIIIGHDEKGNLLFTRANAKGKSIYHFHDGQPMTEISLNTDGQNMHSEITVVKQADSDGGNAGQSTVKNPFVKIFRPTTKVQSSGTDTDTSQAAKSALANELKNIKVEITLSGSGAWKLNGVQLRPNFLIDVTSPQNYINNKTQFFVEQIDLTGTSENQQSKLTCVLPDVHNGNTPKNFFE